MAVIAGPDVADTLEGGADDRTFVTAFQHLDRAIINPWFMATAFLGALVLYGRATA